MNYFEGLKKLMEKRVSDPSRIKEESKLKDLGLDSLDLLEIVTDVEEALNITFTDDELVKFVTVKDVVKAIEGKLA